MVRCLYMPVAFKGLMEVQQQSALNVAMCLKYSLKYSLISIQDCHIL